MIYFTFGLLQLIISYYEVIKKIINNNSCSSSISSSSSSSSSSRTDRPVHFQQNASLRLLCTLELCTASMIAIASYLWGVFCSVFVQAALERVHCSATYNFIW